MTTKPARVRPRFLAPDLEPGSSVVRLPPDESRHLARVLRLEAGAIVGVFDGRGHEFLARVTDTRAAGVELALLEAVAPAPESPVPFTLIQAVLKGAAMDSVVRDATMMGAAAIEPVVTLHTAVRPALAERRAHLDRWRRIAVASAKQARRSTIPDVIAPVPLEAALSAHAADRVFLFVEPSAGRATRSLRTFVGSDPPPRGVLAVGPEGGWAETELDLAERLGAHMVTLGHLTLRAEVVPLVAMAIVRMLWE